MCGRYSLFHSAEDLETRFGATFDAPFRPSYNCAPGQDLPVVTDAEHRRPADPRTLDTGVPGRVPRDDAHVVTTSVVGDATPHRRHVLVAPPGGQRQVDREVRGRDTGDSNVGQHDFEREATGPFQAQFRQDRDRVGGDHDGLATDGEDAEIESVARSDDDVVAARSEIGGDDLLERSLIDLAQVTHRRTLRRPVLKRRLSTTGR